MTSICIIFKIRLVYNLIQGSCILTAFISELLPGHGSKSALNLKSCKKWLYCLGDMIFHPAEHTCSPKLLRHLRQNGVERFLFIYLAFFGKRKCHIRIWHSKQWLSVQCVTFASQSACNSSSDLLCKYELVISNMNSSLKRARKYFLITRSLSSIMSSKIISSTGCKQGHL
jgi:hypothetical protein